METLLACERLGPKVDREGAGLGPAALGNTLLRRAAESLAQCEVFVNWNEADWNEAGFSASIPFPMLPVQVDGEGRGLSSLS